MRLPDTERPQGVGPKVGIDCICRIDIETYITILSKNPPRCNVLNALGSMRATPVCAVLRAISVCRAVPSGGVAACVMEQAPPIPVTPAGMAEPAAPARPQPPEEGTQPCAKRDTGGHPQHRVIANLRAYCPQVCYHA